MSQFRHLNPYERHKLVVNEYILNQPGRAKLLQRRPLDGKRDADVIRENHKFLWDDDEADTWEKRLAKKYYDKLFKEYCICDLSRYRENKIALRWRIEKEVISGKGQFSCGNKVCTSEAGLRSWEVNFAYVEHGEKKNALVKLRLCPECSVKLNYHSKKREVKRIKSMKKRKERKPKEGDRRHSQSPGPSGKRGSEEMKGKMDEETSADEDGNQSTEEVDLTDEKIWTQSRETEEMTREEEFEKYLEDLLL